MDTNPRTFDPANAHRLEDPQRLIWMPPEAVVQRLQIRPGMTIADIGAGTGFFALPFAEAIEPDGLLRAVDLQPAMLQMLEEKLRHPNAPRNVQLSQGEAAKTGLADASCDLVFLANIWHELENAAGVLAEARRLLRAAGRIAILDWRADAPPPPGPPTEHRIAPEITQSTLEQNDWREIQFAPLGKFSYLLTASPA
jgi:ubiquinone/menaquinone biosynthesis C-methylase UbiE